MCATGSIILAERAVTAVSLDAGFRSRHNEVAAAVSDVIFD
jgi:hypothetical protein